MATNPIQLKMKDHNNMLIVFYTAVAFYVLYNFGFHAQIALIRAGDVSRTGTKGIFRDLIALHQAK